MHTQDQVLPFAMGIIPGIPRLAQLSCSVSVKTCPGILPEYLNSLRHDFFEHFMQGPWRIDDEHDAEELEGSASAPCERSYEVLQ